MESVSVSIVLPNVHVLFILLFFSQLWVKERMPLATSTDHGKDLPTVQLLIKKNQVQCLFVFKHAVANLFITSTCCNAGQLKGNDLHS